MFYEINYKVRVKKGYKKRPDYPAGRISGRIIRPFFISGIRPDTRLPCWISGRISGKAGYWISGRISG
jgi:hypothetical protein